MCLRLTVAVVAAFGFVVISAPAALATSGDTQVVSIELVGSDEARFVVDGHRFRGPVTIMRHSDGLVLTERASLEQYLEGIAEVPFSWPEESLEAQAIAARTYLTRVLSGGRSSDGRIHGFDICATSRCQVYRGVDFVEGPSGDRWRSAVENTKDVLVVYDGRPIEAVYSSMQGSRSRANQDVWSSDAVPYLQPVDSPEMGRAPFAEWTVDLYAVQFVDVLRAAGLEVGGSLLGLDVDDPPEGEGRTTITVETEQGTDSILAPALAGAFNRYGEDLYPDRLPARSDDGTEYPSAIPSYTFDIEHMDVAPPPTDTLFPIEDRIDRDRVVIDGEGWGHGVGLSQWGARIMADDGATSSQILEHYYTGSAVVEAPELVPEQVVVGLATGRTEFTVEVDGEAQLRVNGVPVMGLPAGTWIIRSSRIGVDVVPTDPTVPSPPLAQRPWPL